MDEQGHGWCVPRQLDPDITPSPCSTSPPAMSSAPPRRCRIRDRRRRARPPELSARPGGAAAGVGGGWRDAVRRDADRRAARPRAEPQPAPPVVAAGVGVAAVGALALFAAWNRRLVERLVPADGGFVEVDGVRLHCLDRGSGPAIVMIHGLGGQMRNFSHGLLLDRLATDHRVILIDRPGSGYSQAIGANNVRAQAAVIAKAAGTAGCRAATGRRPFAGRRGALALALDHPLWSAAWR